MNIIKMIDNFNKSSKGKVLSSILVFVFSAVLLATACVAYSWFVKSTNVNSGNLALTTKYEAMNATFTSYYINDLDTKTVVKGDQYQDQTTGQTTLDVRLLPYDMTFTSTNQYAPVVVRVKIYDVATNYIPAANETKYVSLVISRKTNLSFTTSAELDGYFSSIGQIGCYSNSTLALNASYSTIYNTILTQYRADQNLMKFTTYVNSTYTKVGFLDKSIAYTSSDFKVDENSKTCLVLYMCFDYNETLAQSYAEQETGELSSNSSLENKFDMLNDISTISVDFN